MSPNVLGVAGSLRHDSWNRRLLGAVAELAGEGLRLTVYDGLEQIPLFNEDARSEEHTSELQSRLHLVCRLLLEKKKNNDSTTTYRRPPSREAAQRAGRSQTAS